MISIQISISLNLKSYLDHDQNADRLIIQVESLLNLDNDFVVEEGLEVKTPAYDLVIIDVVESILNHFSSEQTFKGRNELTFEYMVDILRASNKIITLDGDMNNRSYTFLDKLGKSINIYNTINFNNFKIKNY